jgi:hypothetical protein
MRKGVLITGDKLLFVVGKSARLVTVIREGAKATVTFRLTKTPKIGDASGKEQTKQKNWLGVTGFLEFKRKRGAFVVEQWLLVKEIRSGVCGTKTGHRVIDPSCFEKLVMLHQRIITYTRHKSRTS